MKRIGKHLSVRLMEPGRGQSRYTFMVVNMSNQELGMIGWYDPWRQYCFLPNPMTVFNHECLCNIDSFLGRIRGLRVDYEWSEDRIVRIKTEWDD